MYEVCGSFGELIAELIIDEDIETPRAVARRMAEIVIQTVHPAQRRQLVKQRVARMVDRRGLGSMYLIHLVRQNGEFLQFSGERIEEVE